MGSFKTEGGERQGEGLIAIEPVEKALQKWCEIMIRLFILELKTCHAR
jgi:hypothetical protein